MLQSTYSNPRAAAAPLAAIKQMVAHLVAHLAKHFKTAMTQQYDTIRTTKYLAQAPLPLVKTPGQFASLMPCYT
jgi:hypothetical protein